ncbi:DUF5134 domain-containing protein [Haloechinothrix halophila]|uniref:DUF5134 domain-containing protein n=1 Tax=Haloechinothrix halophila TaxID=1069073 RepID=UPI00146FC4E8|nr:DUF5134 domain-containing protein [Haloechinothrix halophila]
MPVLVMQGVALVLIALLATTRLVHAHPASTLRVHVRREDEAAEVLMSLGMLAMLLPAGWPIPRAGWLAVFALTAVILGVMWVRRRGGACCVPSQCGHHLLGSVAMLLMLAAMAGHSAGHGHGEPLVAAGDPALLTAAGAATAYFAVDVGVCLVRGRTRPAPALPLVLRHRTRLTARAAMNVMMAAMLVSMS